MKIRKQIKNRIVAFAMLTVVVLSSISVSFADLKSDYDGMSLNAISTLKDEWTSNNNINFHREYSVQGPSNVYLMCIGGVYWLVSKENFSVNQVTKLDDGSVYSESSLIVSSDKCSHYNFYSAHISFNCDRVYAPCAVFDYDTWVDLNKKNSSKYDTYPTHVMGAFLFDVYFMEYVKIENSKAEGSQGNPILDSDIGTLVLKKSKCYWVGDGSMDVSQRVQWANKTDTDFSLTNNKYAITRIEVKIGNRVTYFGDVEHHGQGKKVDNFGKVYPFKYVIATDNPHDFSFKDMLSASKTDLTKYNAAMLEHEYDLYFRVVCGTAYGTSAEWHCGNWTRYRVTDDPKQDGKNESDNGHFNDNGEWEKDKDTDVDSGGIGNVDDKDDLEDDFNHFKDSENWKDWLNKEGLDLDSAKTFIDQVADVPKMIGDLFSFFPDWVKYSFALGFALIPVIIVIKFLRG